MEAVYIVAAFLIYICSLVLQETYSNESYNKKYAQFVRKVCEIVMAAIIIAVVVIWFFTL